MTTIKRSIWVPYTTAEMYMLVDNIERYPEFLPWCKATAIHSRNANEVQASITVAKGAVQQSFTTLNRLQVSKMIEVRLVKGPFRHLQGYWRFDAADPTGSQITFDLEFEFSSKLIALTVGPVLQKVAESFIDAFHQRAKDIYGDRT